MPARQRRAMCPEKIRPICSVELETLQSLVHLGCVAIEESGRYSFQTPPKF